MGDALVVGELSQLFAKGAPDFSDAALSRLDFALAEPAVLEMALDALDGGRVCCVRAPSGRALWQVLSGTVGRRAAARGGGGGGGALSGVDFAGSGLCAPGDGGPAYTVLLGGAGCCTCLDFRRRVAAGEEAGRFCAHLLAATLASAARGAPAKARAVSNEELARLLCGALAGAAS
jgi:hypothetical protein